MSEKTINVPKEAVITILRSLLGSETNCQEELKKLEELDANFRLGYAQAHIESMAEKLKQYIEQFENMGE